MNEIHPEDKETDEAREGTAAHELAARMVSALTRNGVGFPEPGDVIGKPAENGVLFDDEMFQAAHEFAAVCREAMSAARVFGGPNLGIERHVNSDAIHQENHGTPDFFCYDKTAGLLTVVDFKYGFKEVDAFENYQLVNYAALIAVELEVPLDTALELVIVQPRSFRNETVKRWTTDLSTVAPMVEELRAGAAAAMRADVNVHSGTHCKNCNALFDCPAGMAGWSQQFEATRKARPANLTTEAMAVLYDIVGRAHGQSSALLLSIETQLKARAASGETIPGYNVEPVSGRQKWNVPEDDVIRMGSYLGLDLRSPKPITPKQAIDSGASADVVNSMSERKSAGVKLVRDATNKKARRVFQ